MKSSAVAAETLMPAFGTFDVHLLTTHLTNTVRKHRTGLFVTHVAHTHSPSCLSLNMGRRSLLEDSAFPDEYRAAATNAIYVVLALYAVQQLSTYLNYPVLSPPELLWNALVFITPTRLLLGAAKRQELRGSGMLSQTHAAKNEALRKMLGVGSSALTHKFMGGEGVMRRLSMSLSKVEVTSDVPPGLGNWDNSCYQNSVLQGLASLRSLKSFLRQSEIAQDDTSTTSGSLQETIAKLNDATNNGKQLWTPAKLKSMSSWQQQDAQEYLSKIMDELDKEAAKSVVKRRRSSGLEAIAEDAKTGDAASAAPTLLRNPMEGLLAQRVACTKCGFSEGLSMIPFNCLTVPLGSHAQYAVRECLDAYTALEEIRDVDCPKCTLLRAEGQLEQMLPIKTETTEPTMSQAPKTSIDLPPELRVLAMQRLQAIQDALKNDDFTDKTLKDVCQIPKKAHVSSTKTRQAVIGRPPQSLIIHINRSVFDEMTGAQRKNYARVSYPAELDLGSWVLRSEAAGSPTQSMLDVGDPSPFPYRLKAVITHYGRHENGHYICYRRHPKRICEEEGNESKRQPELWWRLSDEDVSPVTKEDVLGQGGVFMLFYERDEPQQLPATTQAPHVANVIETQGPVDEDMVLDEAASTPLPTDEDESLEAMTPSNATVTFLDVPADPAPLPPVADVVDPVAEVLRQPPSPVQHRGTPPKMRTAHRTTPRRQASAGESGYGSNLRTVTAI